ncbi:MAG: lipocalin family protein [Bacteroidota bacterium]
MKLSHFFFLGLFLLAPAFMSAQSVVGAWKIADVPTDDGGTTTVTLTFTDAGTYTVDFGSDGSAENNGTYTIDGDKISVKDVGCGDAVGVWQFSISGNTMTTTAIDEPCEGRKGPGSMTMTKI